MPRYHLFGETVTIAEEMEQNGLPGFVAISEVTYKEVVGLFEVGELEPITLHMKPLKNVLPGDPNNPNKDNKDSTGAAPPPPPQPSPPSHESRPSPVIRCYLILEH